MFVIGTAGHVDHGKSLLVEALTGIDPDRLREEKTRGMTIDLGFAWLTLPSGRTVSIVDVPGHERFIKNMLAGAGGIDLALLVVAADDGVMPQTREHLAILDLLGVSRGVVALTKRDLVDDDWLALVEADIVETLRGTTLEGSPVVACSARTREGLDELQRALDEAIDGLPPKRDVGRPRLPIDRVFTIDGFGTVVTGTLIDGAFALGDEVEALPGGARGRIRGLQTHRDKVERALPGTRTAVNIAGVRREDLRRGLVLARPATLLATGVVDARLRAVRPLAHPLRHGMRVTFHAGSDEANAQLRLLDADELRAGDEAWAQIKLDTPVAVVRGDRFVLRTPNDTVAGGAIVDTAPKRHRRRHAPTIAALQALLSDDPERLLLDAIARTPMIEAAALRATLADDGARVELLAKLERDGDVVEFADPRGPRYATAAFVDDAQRRLTETLAAYHREHPLRAGMPSEELRARLALDSASAAPLIERTPRVRADGALVALEGFAPSPSPAQLQTMDAYLAELRTAPFSAPSLTPGREELQYLIDTGAVIDAGDGISVRGGPVPRHARPGAGVRTRRRRYHARAGPRPARHQPPPRPGAAGAARPAEGDSPHRRPAGPSGRRLGGFPNATLRMQRSSSGVPTIDSVRSERIRASFRARRRNRGTMGSRRSAGQANQILTNNGQPADFSLLGAWQHADPAPHTVAETGLPLALLEELMLKVVRTRERPRLTEILRVMAVHQTVCEEVIDGLVRRKLVVAEAADSVLRAHFRFGLTEEGKSHADDACAAAPTSGRRRCPSTSTRGSCARSRARVRGRRPSRCGRRSRTSCCRRSWWRPLGRRSHRADRSWSTGPPARARRTSSCPWPTPSKALCSSRRRSTGRGRSSRCSMRTST